jgi:hypothetical protein
MVDLTYRIPEQILKYCFLIPLSCCLVLLISCSTRSSGAFVEYRRTGGFTNLDDHLVIDPNGNTTITRKTETCAFTLADDEMDQLRNTFDQVKFSELDREYLPESQGADLIEYVITHKEYTVKSKDSAVPDELWPLLESLNQIVEQCP